MIPVHFAGLPAPIDADPRAGRPRRGDHRGRGARARRRLGRGRGRLLRPLRHGDLQPPPDQGDHLRRGRRRDHARPRPWPSGCAVFRHHGMVRDPERFVHPEGAGDEGGWYHEQQDLGFNYRLSDVHAALGHSQLGKLDDLVARRNAIAARYREGLAGIDSLELPPQPRRRRPPRLPPLRRPPARGRRAAGSSSTSGSRERRHPRPGPLHTRLPASLLPRTPSATGPGSARRRSATTRAASRSPATRTSPQPTRTA